MRATVTLTDRRQLEGLVLNQTARDLQLLGDDRKIHLLRKSGDAYRPVTSQADWPSYNGQTSGSRYSPLAANQHGQRVANGAQWITSLPNTSRLQVTPVVVDGVMYVTSANECYALDAGTGREIWHYQRPRTKGLIGNAAGGINRGVARRRRARVHGHRSRPPHRARIARPARCCGIPRWPTGARTTTPPARRSPSATSSSQVPPAAMKACADSSPPSIRRPAKKCGASGPCRRRASRGSETWRGRGIDHPGATTWLTGTYDPELDTLYWPTGNPSPDLIGDDRAGDNLYSDSILALDPKTGRLKWHFQFTPHDVWDYDARRRRP